jgi:hypothetical protein
MPICPVCSTEYVAEVKFCHLDGTPLTRPTNPQDRTPRKCPKCGGQYEGQKFCARDGTPLIDVTP